MAPDIAPNDNVQVELPLSCSGRVVSLRRHAKVSFEGGRGLEAGASGRAAVEVAA